MGNLPATLHQQSLSLPSTHMPGIPLLLQAEGAATCSTATSHYCKPST